MIQQQVEEIRFEEVYITKFKHKAHKTNKIRDWLSLLKAYHENNMFQQKDQTIRTMHFKFILSEDFWIQEITRKKQQQNICKKDIQLIMMALDDGYYERAAQIIYKILIKQLKELKNNSGELGQNYIIGQIQKIILIFKRGMNFFQDLRCYYKQLKNQTKIRQIYLRQIKYGYDNIDIIYDQYTLWQKNKEELQKSKNIYQQGKNNWQKWNLSGHLQFLNLNQTDRAPYDSINQLKLIDKLQTDVEKLRYLRILCLGRHQLTCQYFQKLQHHYQGNQDLLILSYKNVLDILPEIQILYLRFLVRRINKHLQQTQDNQYNQHWAQKVQFFREQITQLINKPRLTPKTQQSIRQSYYNYWVDVQTALIKDKDSVCQIFQALLQIKNSVELFTKYSQSMIKLGFIADAKHILKRSYTGFKYDYEAYKQYENFISVYGTIEDAIQFRKLKMLQKSEMDIQNNINGLNKGQTVQIIEPESNKRYNLQKSSRIEAIIDQQMNEININLKNSSEKQKQKQKVTTKQLNQQKGKGKEKQQKKEKPIQTTKQKQKQEQIDIQQQRQKNKKAKMHTDSGNTLFVKGFPNSWRQQEIKNILKNKDRIKQIRLIQKMGQYQTYCYVQMISPEDALKQVQQHKDNKQIIVAISKPPASYNEDRTIFLCALPHSTTYQKIRALFQQQNGNIVEIRLKLDQNKNIAYVDFSSPQIALTVFQKYSKLPLIIDNKKILIKQSHSKPIVKKKQLKVLVLKQLAFKAKEKDIIQFFKDFSLQDVYVPENDEGKSKGFAFVKFKHENQFYQALSMKKGMIKNRTFQIHRSERDIQRPKKEKKQQKQKQVNNNYFSDLFK